MSLRLSPIGARDVVRARCVGGARGAVGSREAFYAATRAPTSRCVSFRAGHVPRGSAIPQLTPCVRTFTHSAKNRYPWKTPAIGDRPVAVLGGGVLGRRIATTWIAAGYQVILCDLSEGQRNAAAHYIEHHLEEYSRLVGSKRKAGSYDVVPDIDTAVKDAWLVVEALPEKLPLKISIMGELDQKAPHDCIIASNSSSYKSRFMLEKVEQSRRNRILNMHYYMPPTNQTVELMTCGETEPQVLEFLKSRLQDAGMFPAVARKESTGFIFNRLRAAIKPESLLILAEGVSEPKEIDQLFLTMFKDNPAGPCAMMDAVGLDTVYLVGLSKLAWKTHGGMLTATLIATGRYLFRVYRGGFAPYSA